MNNEWLIFVTFAAGFDAGVDDAAEFVTFSLKGLQSSCGQQFATLNDRKPNPAFL